VLATHYEEIVSVETWAVTDAYSDSTALVLVRKKLGMGGWTAIAQIRGAEI